MAGTPDWLTQRPIAHRGLHDRIAGRIENSLSAARAALDAGFAIECDVQRSNDGEAMVFHDITLERLTGEDGAVAGRSASDLDRLTLAGSADCIATLPALLDVIGGRVPLICEIKSAFEGDMRLAERAAEVALAYSGPIALKSFDPAVLVHLRENVELAHHGVPLGLVAEAHYSDPEWDHLGPDRKAGLAALTEFSAIRPDFLSYAVHDLPHAAASLFRWAWKRPVMCWTVRTPDQRQRAARWADQIVFEGFIP